jgi:twitching motility protein PilT
MATIDGFFKMMKEQGASDLHLVSGQQPIVRIDGEIERIKYPVLQIEDLKKMIYEIAPEQKIKQFEEEGDVDFAYELSGVGRFRANFFKQVKGIGAIFRIIPNNIFTLDQLKLPKIFKTICSLEKGLVLVTGPTGSGKSTTLAAMIDEINKTKKSHILTIEEPVEFIHKSQMASINHREVGTHTQSFYRALKGALREDPDIILVGEMRDLETISLALEAANTGHLVFGTLHTQSSTQTIDRIIDVFPANEQSKIKVTLAESLKAVIAQTLVKKISGGRAAAIELMICNSAIATLIREGKTHQITSMIQTGKNIGMQLLDDNIEKLLIAKQITPEMAIEKAVNKERFLKYLKQGYEDIFS